MGEEHFAQFGIQRLFPCGEGQHHVPQAQTLQGLRPVLLRLQADQDWGRGNDGVPERFGETVTVAGRTGGGIAQAAAGQDDRAGRKKSSVCKLSAGDPAVFRFQTADARVQPDPDVLLPQQAGQRLCDVAGFFGNGKDALSALYRDRAAVPFQQGHHILRRKKVQRAVKKPRIAGDLGKEPVPVAVIGQVAAAFAGDVDFLPKLFVLFQQGDVRPRTGGEDSGHHAGCAASDDQDV